MTSEEFRDYLRDLQRDNVYNWPNDYFAWQKPDKSLFMVGIASSQMYQIMKYEIDQFQNQCRMDMGLEPNNAYCAVLYSISPTAGHMKSGSIPYDPVEELVSQVSGYTFMGSWRDPDRFMDDPTFTRVLAHGRWELAKEHILQPEKKPSLAEQIAQAQNKTATQTPRQERDCPGVNFSR